MLEKRARHKSAEMRISCQKRERAIEELPHLNLSNKFEILNFLEEREKVTEVVDEYEDGVRAVEELLIVLRVYEVRFCEEWINKMKKFVDKFSKTRRNGSARLKIQHCDEEDKSEHDHLILAIQEIIAAHQESSERAGQRGKKACQQGEDRI